jgi:hypothetical protein
MLPCILKPWLYVKVNSFLQASATLPLVRKPPPIEWECLWAPGIVWTPWKKQKNFLLLPRMKPQFFSLSLYWVRKFLYEIWDFHGSEDSCCGLLDNDTTWSCKWLHCLHLYFFPEDGDSMFIQNDDKHLPDYMSQKTTICRKYLVYWINLRLLHLLLS